jgi:hypothetical protein
VAVAMKKAAENIAAHVPAESTSVSAPVPGETPAGGKQQFTPISRTSTNSGHAPSRQQVEYDKQTRSSGNWGWVILVVGGIILAIIIISVAGAFGAARRYGTGYGGYGPGYGGYGYGGYGYGGYGGGGDMLTGMMLGGMMGNMFGGGGRSVEHHYHGSAPSGGFDMGSSGSGFGSWGGGDSSGGSWGSSFTDAGGGFSSFGGGDFGGGSSGGEW